MVFAHSPRFCRVGFCRLPDRGDALSSLLPTVVWHFGAANGFAEPGLASGAHVKRRVDRILHEIYDCEPERARFPIDVAHTSRICPGHICYILSVACHNRKSHTAGGLFRRKGVPCDYDDGAKPHIRTRVLALGSHRVAKLRQSAASASAYLQAAKCRPDRGAWPLVARSSAPRARGPRLAASTWRARLPCLEGGFAEGLCTRYAERILRVLARGMLFADGLHLVAGRAHSARL